MMFKKMQNLFVLIALLLFCTSPTETKVVGSMANCSQFFLDGISPNIPGILEEGNISDQNRYKTICQTLNNTETFVTLYDTENRIPVFSASKYTGNDGNRPKTPWKIEPQLENNMQDEGEFIYSFQAGPTDYRNNPKYDKGHLLPSSYGLTPEDRESTFTLTNIVPQVKNFNQKSWNNMEQCVKCVLDEFCFNNNNQKEGFVVIGAQPSESNILNNRINIPSFLWSAFCCYSTSTTEKKWLASAHWGENVEPADNYLKTITLKDLYKKLGDQFNVFPKTQCPLDTTVTGLYPSLNQKECKCPPITPTAPPATTAKGTTLKPTSLTTTAVVTQADEESSTKPSSSPPHWNEEDDYTDYSEDAAFKFLFEKRKRIPSRYLPRVHPGSPEMATTRHLNRCRNCFLWFDQSLDQLLLCLRRKKCIIDSKNAYRSFGRSNLHFSQIEYD